MSYSIIGNSSKNFIFAFVVSFVIFPTFFVIFSGCVSENKPEEYTGVLFDSIYEDSNNNVYIFFDNGKKQIDIYSDSKEYTVRQIHILVQHNIGHKVRIVFDNYECSWFEILD
jgi:hypothetical protein